jgi:aspartyl-tRNA(Asn)/glutamyl-tRNA(Gln) amidotransferase subunit A
MPFALKDIINTAGILTTAHSKVLRDNVPAEDAAVTAKLYAAGAVLMGKLATHEFAHGGPSYDLPWPIPRNPWNLQHFVGGSSSGSAAAIAAGLVPASIGTDTGGSIRGPAGLAGITGLKPTYGLVSRRGVIPNSYSFDHCGPMAWTVEDCAILLQAVAGHDPADPASAAHAIPDYRSALATDLHGVRIGVIRHFWEEDIKVDPVDDTHMSNALDVLAGLGALIENVRIRPLLEYSDVRTLIAEIELFSVHHENLLTRAHEFGADILRKMLPACLFQGIEYVHAQRQRAAMQQEFNALYLSHDVLITAGLGPAPRLDSIINLDFWRKPNILYPFSIAGGPVLAVCNGFSPAGLPTGMQIAAAPFKEETVFRVGHAYEKATKWRSVRPGLVPHALAPAFVPPDATPRPNPDAVTDALVSVLAGRAGIDLGARELALLREAAPYALAMASRIRRDHPTEIEPAPPAQC